MKDFSEREEIIASQIVDAAIKVHQSLRPGLLEKVYKAFFVMSSKKDILNTKDN